MAEGAPLKDRIKAAVSGVVQGVGFRPFVARIARECGLSGFVRNDGGIVTIEAEGAAEDLRRFLAELRDHPPRGTLIEKIDIERTTSDLSSEAGGFAIRESGDGSGEFVMPTPDIAVCDDCLREMNDPHDPRFRNPFISCTLCGPRYSIIERLPYDRGNISMSEFPMCGLCASQYGDASDRRCHAQTVCCNNCGPVLRFYGGESELSGEDAMQAAINALKNGMVIAVKGIGGFHLACSPFIRKAVLNLRAIKGREEKPFAAMFRDIDDIRRHCLVNSEEEKLLLSRERPIVLLEYGSVIRGENAACAITGIDKSVYGNSRFMGAFLPYTPLQHMILAETGPLVMTSANQTDFPIIKDDNEMLRFYNSRAAGKNDSPDEGLAGVLTHNREIVRRLDDSVAAVVGGKPQFLRRARGYVPMPLTVSNAPRQSVLACGPQQKNTVSLTKGPYIYPSTEIGDLDSDQSLEVYRNTITDMQNILRIRPELVVCDLHPFYPSTQYASQTGLPVIQVQHHYAHIASVMAENGITGKVIGAAFDGTGYGTDGTIWGGEFLIASPGGFTRAGHLKPFRLLGSDESIRQGWKTAACMLHQAGIDIRNGEPRMALVKAALDAGVNVIRSSSMGRVFDAVSAILGICDYSDYEGQCAIELENAAAGYAGRDSCSEPFPYELAEEEGVIKADLLPCIRAIYQEKAENADIARLAWRFHLTISEMLLDICGRLRVSYGLTSVALSGGVFQNRILTSQTVPMLEKAGFTVYTNHIVPPGDGGISLGQAFIGMHAEIRD